MLSASIRRASFVKSPSLNLRQLRFFSMRMEPAEVPMEQSESAPELSPDQFRKKHQIYMSGVAEGKEYEPVKSFSTSPFSAEIRKVLTKQGYDTPTPIQAQSWPIIMENKDIISVARTGSGKTVGFLMPAIQKLLEAKQKGEPERLTASGRVRRGPAKVPTVLVLAPTRELTVQIEKEAQKYCINGISSVCVYGGASKSPQVNALREGVDIVVATPGRCNDLNIMGALDLSQINYLVLDEADRMLDMGFEPQIREIVDQLPENRQTVFFTATWPREVQSLAKSFLIDPVQINVGDSDVLNANKNITQNIIVTNSRDKLDELFDTLEKINPSKDPSQVPKTLIFCSRKADCDFLCDKLYDERYKAEGLHGDKSQSQRDFAMDKFRTGRTRLLVATDVAARGLDVKDIENVINYDFPNNVEDYVHRIGRTARGENKGTAYTFLTAKETSNRGMMAQLADVMKRAEQPIPNEIAATLNSSRGSYGDRPMRSSARYAAPTASNRGNSSARGFSFSNFGDRQGGFSSGGNSSSIFGGRGSMSSRFDSDRGSGGATFGRSANPSNFSFNKFKSTSNSYDSGDNLDDDDYSPRLRKTFKPRFDEDDGEFEPKRRSSRRDRDYDDF